jgi:hypothetical protein
METECYNVIKNSRTEGVITKSSQIANEIKHIKLGNVCVV